MRKVCSKLRDFFGIRGLVIFQIQTLKFLGPKNFAIYKHKRLKKLLGKKQEITNNRHKNL